MVREDNVRALAVADRVLDAAERADLVPIVADTLVTKGVSLAGLHRAYEGLADIEGGLQLAERHGLAAIALRARINLGTLWSIGPAAVMENYRIGLAEALRRGQRRLVMTFVANAAETGFWTGDWDWASSELDELLGGELDRRDRVPLLESLIRIRSWRGEEVDALAADLERLAAEIPEPQQRYSAAVSSRRPLAGARRFHPGSCSVPGCGPAD